MAAKKRKKRTRPRGPEIRAGHFVKCIFRTPDPRGPVERMWLHVTGVHGNAIRGTLDSKPLLLRGIRYGDAITVPRSAVIQHLIAK
jgi:uncharacterized protein YegJ (DUF2314 family)